MTPKRTLALGLAIIRWGHMSLFGDLLAKIRRQPREPHWEATVSYGAHGMTHPAANPLPDSRRRHAKALPRLAAVGRPARL